ncbi:hypothetical protein BpHYR1_001024 [Brachionus plicatilis]|uniref:Uncharacterized protein n=1 Tax=Brachionus plicatilis TaxID=10195 RepID=A0A3M7QB05_BRAPC|nr:hypothetical protein BpHYR1_001024 [Brachionus plicatilis]
MHIKKSGLLFTFYINQKLRKKLSELNKSNFKLNHILTMDKMKRSGAKPWFREFGSTYLFSAFFAVDVSTDDRQDALYNGVWDLTFTREKIIKISRNFIKNQIGNNSNIKLTNKNSKILEVSGFSCINQSISEISKPYHTSTYYLLQNK